MPASPTPYPRTTLCSSRHGQGRAHGWRRVAAARIGAALWWLLSGAAPAGWADDSLWQSLVGGKPDLFLRYRFEYADDARPGLKQAYASTLRSAVGYRTGTFHDASLYVQIQDVRVVGNDRLFNDGSNRVSDRAVITDVESTEIQQYYLRYGGLPRTVLTLGRQEITHPGHRSGLGSMTCLSGRQKPWLRCLHGLPVSLAGLHHPVGAADLRGRSGGVRLDPVRMATACLARGTNRLETPVHHNAVLRVARHLRDPQWDTCGLTPGRANSGLASEYARLARRGAFFRIHNSFLGNLTQAWRIRPRPGGQENFHLVSRNGDELPVARAKLARLRELLEA